MIRKLFIISSTQCNIHQHFNILGRKLQSYKCLVIVLHPSLNCFWSMHHFPLRPVKSSRNRRLFRWFFERSPWILNDFSICVTYCMCALMLLHRLIVFSFSPKAMMMYMHGICPLLCTPSYSLKSEGIKIKKIIKYFRRCRQVALPSSGSEEENDDDESWCGSDCCGE